MEIAIMKKLTHPNLIQLYEVIDYDDGDKLYMSKNFLIGFIITLVMDFAEHGEILKWN